MTVQFLEIAGRRMAVMPEEEYQRLCESIEETADVRAAVAAEDRARHGEEYVPATLIDRIAAGEPPLRVWREYRGFSPQALSELAGVAALTIMGIETERRDAGSRDWQRLASALAVDVDDILPADLAHDG